MEVVAKAAMVAQKGMLLFAGLMHRQQQGPMVGMLLLLRPGCRLRFITTAPLPQAVAVAVAAAEGAAAMVAVVGVVPAYQPVVVG